MRSVTNHYVYKYGILIGYSIADIFIEKHYSCTRNYNVKQTIDYRVSYFEKLGKKHIFKTMKEAKMAVMEELNERDR